jgi:hypothetical protein
LGKMVASLPSSSSTKWIQKTSPLRWDPWLNPARVLPAPVASELDTLPDLFLVLAVRVCGGRGVCASPVEAPRCGAPGATWWKPSQVAPGRPRGHCPAMPSRHAPGCLVSAFLFLSNPLFFGHGH